MWKDLFLTDELDDDEFLYDDFPDPPGVEEEAAKPPPPPAEDEEGKTVAERLESLEYRINRQGTAMNDYRRRLTELEELLEDREKQLRLEREARQDRAKVRRIMFRCTMAVLALGLLLAWGPEIGWLGWQLFGTVALLVAMAPEDLAGILTVSLAAILLGKLFAAAIREACNDFWGEEG